MLLDRREWPPDTVRVHWHPLYCGLKPRRLRSRFRAKNFKKICGEAAANSTRGRVRSPGSENDDSIAYTHEVFHARSVPVRQPNAAVTCGAADCLWIVRAVNADARFVQAHPQDPNEVVWARWEVVIVFRAHTIVEHAFIVAKPRPNARAENFPRAHRRR